VKITLPGPFTMSQQAFDEAYGNAAELAMDLAAAVNEEIRDLFAAGADVVQIDEPWLQARPDAAREYAVAAIDRALEGIDGTTALHTCFGYAHVVTDKPAGYPFLATSPTMPRWRRRSRWRSASRRRSRSSSPSACRSPRTAA
jgi:5-methyltetrahydropteroyltriglutamate--homocysteine methyltransferase